MTTEAIIVVSIILIAFDNKVIASINKYAEAIKSWFNNKETK